MKNTKLKLPIALKFGDIEFSNSMITIEKHCSKNLPIKSISSNCIIGENTIQFHKYNISHITHLNQYSHKKNI